MLQTQFPGNKIPSRSSSWPWNPLEAPGPFPEQGQSCSLCTLTVSCSPLWSSCTPRGSGSGRLCRDKTTPGNVSSPSLPCSCPGSSSGMGQSPQISPLRLQGVLLRGRAAFREIPPFRIGVWGLLCFPWEMMWIFLLWDRAPASRDQ